MKVYRIEICVIDFDNIGEAGVRGEIENANYGNDCIYPTVKKIETKEVDWSDNHPLNNRNTADAAYKELFKTK